jgi:hypothetical protein
MAGTSTHLRRPLGARATSRHAALVLVHGVALAVLLIVLVLAPGASRGTSTRAPTTPDSGPAATVAPASPGPAPSRP